MEDIRVLKIKSEIVDLKNKLRATDYKALKFAEGWLTIEEYEPIREERWMLRKRINELEEQLKKL